MPDNDSAPVTRSDLAALEQRIMSAIERTNQALQRTNEALERTETKLLTEFHKWAQTYEVRSRGTVQVVHNFEERLMILEERVGNLERRPLAPGLSPHSAQK